MSRTTQKILWAGAVLALSIGAATAILVGTANGAEVPQAVSELERTKMELAVEKQKSNAAQAQIIRSMFEQNQVQGRILQDSADKLHDDVCRAHGIEPKECDFTQDGAKVYRKPAAAAAAPAPTPAEAGKPPVLSSNKVVPALKPGGAPGVK